MEAISYSEICVPTYKTTRYQNNRWQCRYN